MSNKVFSPPPLYPLFIVIGPDLVVGGSWEHGIGAGNKLDFNANFLLHFRGGILLVLKRYFTTR